MQQGYKIQDSIKYKTFANFIIDVPVVYIPHGGHTKPYDHVEPLMSFHGMMVHSGKTTLTFEFK